VSAKVKVFLAGEGSNELGSFAGHPAYHDDERHGVLHALLTRIQPDGWEVGGARTWKSIRKLRARGATHADTHNVLGATLDAKEARCDVLAFCRDRDTDHERVDAIKTGIARAPTEIPGSPPIVGGVAIPLIEGWLLAVLGEPRTETMSPSAAQKALEARGHAAKDGEAMVRAIEDADLGKLPPDATSLHAWLAQARAVLPPLVASRLAP